MMADLILTAALASVFTVDGTALVSNIKTFETEIGDVKQPDFHPQVKIKRFENAANLSVRYLSDEPAEVSIDDTHVVYRTKTRELRFYNDGGFDEGGTFKIEGYFFERPAAPVLVFSLETKDLEMFEQPPLAHENADGSTWEIATHGGRRERPAHVNGSYAIYAKGLSGDYSALGGLNYKTGKLCHIYRPWIEDAHGWRVWCALAIDEGAKRLTTTIPQDFYEQAALPWHLDPTFGYTTHGASDDNPSNNFVWCKATSTPASSGTLNSLTQYGRIKVLNPIFDCAIYSDTAGAPDARLAAVDTGGTAYTGSDSEITTNITYASLTSGVQYWLGLTPTPNGTNALTNDSNMKFDSNGGATELFFISNVGSFPNTAPWPATAAGAGSATNERISEYGTYTASGGPTVDQWIGALDQLSSSGIMVGLQYK